MKTEVREGLAHSEILEEAAAASADLIVMGAEGHRALDELVFGSNTARVARAATCPVLIVPAGKQEKTRDRQTATGIRADGWAGEFPR